MHYASLPYTVGKDALLWYYITSENVIMLNIRRSALYPTSEGGAVCLE